MKVLFDKFYTKEDVVDLCLKEIDLSIYDTIIEPSAGNGSFSKKLDCIAYDIEPEDSSIIKQDFLQLKEISGNNKLFIGNPPFGSRSCLAKDFIKHSIELGANTIAFILPDTFNKYTNQKVFPKEWKLLKVIKLPKDSFLVNNDSYHVPCSFFIWSKILNGKDLRDIKYTSCEDFIFLKRGSTEADFSINGCNGKVKELKDITNTKAEHYIKVINKNVKEVKERLSNINYNFNSSVNGGNAWINQSDIIKSYLENGGK